MPNCKIRNRPDRKISDRKMKTRRWPESALGEDGLLTHFYFSVLNFSVCIVWQVRSDWQDAIMPACDGVLKVRAILNFGPQQELLRIRGNPRSRPDCSSGFAKLGFRVSSFLRASIFGFRIFLVIRHSSFVLVYRRLVIDYRPSPLPLPSKITFHVSRFTPPAPSPSPPHA